ncbi:gp653 [Bacillus phage G]|uniref:Gp653 n=1 Tax=Bacillus phage G TaxID=2884420 RepID=G3MB33_9CAUD|nr:gp653 [Bacillus phage G]AEO93896.1 gp653 [Bacillus phage G]
MTSKDFLETWHGQRFQERLLKSLETIGSELRRANDLKEEELIMHKKDSTKK